MSAQAPAAERGAPAVGIVAGQELRDLWLGGRALLMILGFSVLLSVIAYLTATNTALNFLEQRESVSLTLQVAIGVGSLLALLVAADTFSGERERGTLESLLLTPAVEAADHRREAACGAVSVVRGLPRDDPVRLVPRPGRRSDRGRAPHRLRRWYPARDLPASLGLVISVFAGSNRVSLSLSLLILLALFAPTQLPAGAQKGWGETLLYFIPVTAGERYVSRIVVDGHPWDQDLTWLISSIVAAVVFAVLALVVGSRFVHLRGGV